MLNKANEVLSLVVSVVAILMLLYVGHAVATYYNQMPPDYSRFEKRIRLLERAKVVKEFQSLQSLPEFNQCFKQVAMELLDESN